MIRLSPDERLVACHGRLGKDYPEEDHLPLLRSVVASVREELVDLVAAGHSALLDHGLGTRAERDECKRLVVGLGARWKPVRFPVDRSELPRRLAARNETAWEGRVSPADLAWIAGHSRDPCGEGEELPETCP